MFAVWSESGQQVRIHSSALAGGTALMRDDNVANLPAAEAWLAGWGFLTTEPWEPDRDRPGELRAPLARRTVPVQ